MKILYLITSLDRGGAELYLRDLALGVSKAGNDVVVGYYKGNGYFAKELRNSGIKVIYLGTKSKNKIIFRFFHFLYLIFFW